ncbi:MAG: hypothetical protein AB2A00_20855 [Myxococcota bacterium]
MDERKLREKLAKVEALLSGAGTAGEQAAAANARERIMARLAEMARADPPVEHQFSLPDTYSRALFVALARRYGMAPYRKRGQRRGTVMLKAPAGFIKDIFFPEFRQLADELHALLAQATQELVSRVVHADTSEEGEAPALSSGKA